MEKGYIYKITNLINNKFYIGCTNNPERRWKEHQKGANSIQHKRLYEAIRNDGIENFKFEIVKECPIEDMFKVESELIDELGACIPNIGYNASQSLGINIVDTKIKENLDFKYEKSIEYFSEYIWYDNFYKKLDLYGQYKQDIIVSVSDIDDRGIEWKNINELGEQFEIFSNYQMSKLAEIRNRKTLTIIKRPPSVKKQSFLLKEVYARLFDREKFNEVLKSHIPWTYNWYKNYSKHAIFRIDQMIYGIDTLLSDDDKEFLKTSDKLDSLIKSDLVYYSKEEEKPSIEKLALDELKMRIDEAFGFKSRSSDFYLTVDTDRMFKILTIIKFKDSKDKNELELFNNFKSIVKPNIEYIFAEFIDELNSLGINETSFIYESDIYKQYKKYQLL